MRKPRRNSFAHWCRRGAIILSFVVPWIASAEISKVQFLLRNGDRITGIVVSETANRVTLTNALVGQISFAKAEIISRDDVNSPATNATTSVAQAAALQKHLEELESTYLADQISGAEYYRRRAKLLSEFAGTGANSLSQTNGSRPGAPPNVGVPATALVNPSAGVKPASPAVEAKPRRQFSGEIFAGADIAEGSKSRQLYTGRLKLNYIEGHLRNSADYLFTYGNTDGELTANRMDGTLKTDYEFTPRTYGYNQVAGGYDELRKIDDYFQIGPGAGYHLVKLSRVALSTEAGLNYQAQDFTDGREEQNVYYRLAQQFKWVINTRFSLDEKVEYFPQWDNASEYKVRFEGNVRYWLKSYLSLNLTVINLYDTRVAPGIQPNDLQIRSSIGVKF